MIPFVDLQAQRRRLGGSVERRIEAVLSHGQFIMGPEVEELEAVLADRVSVDQVVSCASGTDALVMALMAMGVGPGDAVLVPTFTFTATAEAVVLVGAMPVFCDVRAQSFLIDVDGLDAGLDAAQGHGARAVGVVPVDLFGQPADYEAICSWAARRGLWVIADAAQSVGGSIEGVAVGALAPVTTTSFFPAKPLGGYGDGGAIFVENAEVAERLRSIREHGRGSDRYHTERIGLNGRLDTIQAAVLLAKLEIFDEELQARDEIARRYDENLAGAVNVPAVREGVRSTWAQYTLRTPHRDSIIRALADVGIPAAVYYPVPLHRQPPYARYPSAAPSLPVAEELCGEVVSLPIHPYLDRGVQQRIIDEVRSAVSEPVEA